MVKYIEVFAQRVCILGECRGPTVEFFALETGQHWEDPAPNEPLLLSVRRRREPQVVPSCAPAPSGSFGPKEKRRATQNPKGPKRTFEALGIALVGAISHLPTNRSTQSKIEIHGIAHFINL